MGKLEGKVALITGGGSGIGRAVVERFIAEGAKVGVLELSPEKVADLNENLDNVIAVQGDVRNYLDNERVVRETVNRFGKIDVLVANAGIFDFGVRLIDIPVEKLDGAFDEIFHINVKGYMHAVRAALPELLKTRGNIIMTLSFSSFYVSGGGPLYVASKHAVLGLMKQLAYELAPKVRVNGVAPGIAPTVMRGIQALDQGVRPALLEGEKVAQRFPLPILPSPADHAGAYVYLASDEARIVTGTVICTDNGAGVRGVFQPAGGTDL